MERTNPNYYVGLADDAEMLQAAVDAAAPSGETVTIPRRNLRTGEDVWILPRAVLLHSGSVICLDNCHLRQADGSFDNIFRNANARTEAARTRAGRQYDIRIYGRGNALLDGGRHNGLTERTQTQTAHIIQNTAIHFHNAERLTVENLRIIHQRWWGMTFHYCSAGRVSNIDFMGGGNAPNQDGVDLRIGCSGFVIENISGYTQDDSVALTCMNHSTDERMRVEEMDTSIHNVVVRNITTATRCAQVRLLNHDGGKIYNILIENVQNYTEIDPADPAAAGYRLRIPHSLEYVIGSETSPALPEPYWSDFTRDQRPGASVRIGENHYYRNWDKPSLPSGRAQPGDTYNITIRNVQSRAKFGVTVACVLEDALIDNVQMYGDAMNAVYFGEGIYRNIRVRDLGFTGSAGHRDKDVADAQSWKNYSYDAAAPVLFNGCDARGLFFDGVTAGERHEAVFAGHGQVEFRARGVLRRNPGTRLVLGEELQAKTED